LSAPLLKKVSRVLAEERRELEACLEEALEAWLRHRQDARENNPRHPNG
jgi:hypothetical protein